MSHTPAGSAIELRAEQKGGAVQISVSDDGPGIPDEAKKHLFDFPSIIIHRRSRWYFRCGHSPLFFAGA